MKPARRETILDLEPRAARRVLIGWLRARGEPEYRIRQIMPRLWQCPVGSWSEATDLPKPLRARLDEDFPLPRLERCLEQRSTDGTRKQLWALPDGEKVESVWIPHGQRRTLCISSQVGCALGCVFCATGLMGFRRNLSPWEILAQVRELILADETLRPSNVVFMGMGEPLLNWEAVDVSLSVLNARDGLGIGARHITVSTVGILPALAKLAERDEQFRLAISLHAPSSPRRQTLMPIERKYRLPMLMEALRAFRRRVTFEYVMIAGRNDTEADADDLARLARPLGAMVNLLPLHPGGAGGLEPVLPRRMQSFARRLRTQGIEAVVRRSRGLDIDAACGQLRVRSDAGHAPMGAMLRGVERDRLPDRRPPAARHAGQRQKP